MDEKEKISQTKYIGCVDQKYLQTLAVILKPFKERSFELMHIQPGHKVIDIGCGPGTDTIRMAELVGQAGQVVGIDFDCDMILTANKKAKETGLEDRVLHRYCDAISTIYDNDSFDASRSERLFQHVLNPEQVLSEMLRITKPMGWIVVGDTDHSTLTIDNSDVDIEWRLRRFRTDKLKNGYAGRQLYRLFKQQNLKEIIVEIFPIFLTDYSLLRYLSISDIVEKEAILEGIITEEEQHRWHTNLKQADEKGEFFSNFNIILVAGRKY